jgi:hypothetical protein
MERLQTSDSRLHLDVDLDDVDLDFEKPKTCSPKSDARLRDDNRDDTGAGLPGGKVGSDALLHGEPAALIAAKANGG